MGREKTRYEITAGNYVLASMTLYGDEDEDTKTALWLLMKESAAVARLITGQAIISVKKHTVNL